jgi:hypothetical protein
MGDERRQSDGRSRLRPVLCCSGPCGPLLNTRNQICRRCISASTLRGRHGRLSPRGSWAASSLWGPCWPSWPVWAVAHATEALPPGNNGTVKIDGAPFDDQPNNEPHPAVSSRSTSTASTRGTTCLQPSRSRHYRRRSPMVTACCSPTRCSSVKTTAPAVAARPAWTPPRPTHWTSPESSLSRSRASTSS